MRIVAGLESDLSAVDQRHMRAAHDPGARITAGIAENAELLQIDVFNACLLPQLARCGLPHGFSRPDKTAGQRPASQKWMAAAFDQQHAQLLFGQAAVVAGIRVHNRKNDHIARHRWTRIIAWPISF